jgi:hypothetical protein
MKIKALTAAQIDCLAQRLSDTPVEPATSAKQAGDAFARLLAARIGNERAALAFTSILTADTFDQVEARLTFVLDYSNPEPAGEPSSAAEEELNRPGFTGGQNSRSIAHYGTEIKEENLEAVFTRVARARCGWRWNTAMSISLRLRL